MASAIVSQPRQKQRSHPFGGMVDPPPLVNGDRLTRPEFERRYHAMPKTVKAELIEGVVYMPPPVHHLGHSKPHGMMMGWLATYAAVTPGVDWGDNATVRLDADK